MRYIIGFLITIGLIILLIVSLAGGGNNGKQKVPSSQKPLDSYASTSALVRMTIDGPINAQQKHDQIRITVGKDSATYEHLNGYDGSVKEAHTYPNTEAAYDNFLHALSVVGFTNGDNAPALRDERGQCPLENRYIYELIQGNADVFRYWTSDCNKPRTYNGLQTTTRTLFEQQIPDYDKLTSNANFGR
jgi:hypothetical protein